MTGDGGELRQSLTSSEPSPRGSCSSVFSKFTQSTSFSASSSTVISRGLSPDEVGVGGSSNGVGVVLAASRRAIGPNDSVLVRSFSVSWVDSTGVGGMSRFRQSGCVCSELDWMSDSETVTIESWLGAWGIPGDAGAESSISLEVS